MNRPAILLVSRRRRMPVHTRMRLGGYASTESSFSCCVTTFLYLRVALDQQLIGREQRAVGFGPLRSVRTAPRLLDL
jgi:hypothetical protein